MKKLKEKEQNYCQPDVAVITDNGGYTSSVNSKISMYWETALEVKEVIKQWRIA